MSRVLIIGTGFLGLEMGRQFRQSGWEVEGISRSGSATAQAETRIIACDVTDMQSARAQAALFREADVVVFAASSGRGGAEAYRRIFITGLRHVLELAPRARFIFTGSTSVYGQTSGEWVDEESRAEPAREAGKILLQAEELVLYRQGCVLRLAGFYGPGRSVHLRKFLGGSAVIEGNGMRWLNQIHRDDAAAALVHLANRSASGVFNVTDDTPMTQRRLYEILAETLGRPLPPGGPIDFTKKRGWTSKRVSNAKLRATGWRCEYPSYETALQRHGAGLLTPAGLDDRPIL